MNIAVQALSVLFRPGSEPFLTNIYIVIKTQTMQHVKSKLIIPGIIFASFFLSQQVKAQGDLLLTPKRIVFDDNRKTQEVNLANTGKDTATYLVSIVEIRMTEDGNFEEILQPDPNQKFASKYLRFFPRSVKLGPNEAQTVKIQLTKASQLPPGEYRSHIYFRPLKNPEPLGETPAPDSKDLVVNIVPVVGLSIPVIVRVGNYDASVSISDVSVDKSAETPTIKMSLNRTGDMSVYGDIIVDEITPDGKSTQVGFIKGIAVYTPNAKRILTLQLDKRVKTSSNKLHITYKPQSDDKLLKTRPVHAEADYVGN